MPEARVAARRHPALAPGLADTTGPVAIRPLPAATRFSLRVKGIGLPSGSDPSGPEGGWPLGLPVNFSAPWGERLVARLGPDEWLLVGPEGDAPEPEIAEALGERFHSLVDVSHRQVGIAVEGASAAVVLNAGCPLDLHPSAFPAGSATRTLLGKAEIVLFRPGEAPAFRVEVWRSFAAYAFGFLLEASRDV